MHSIQYKENTWVGGGGGWGVLRLRGKKHQEIEEMSQNLSNLSVGLGTFLTILGIFVIKTFYFFFKKF